MRIIDIARSQLGVHESPPNSNRVLYSDWYGMVGPWCDMFVSWCADQAGEAQAVGRFAYTPSHEAWFRSNNREVPVSVAAPGDIVFFNFIGRTSHVGIVEATRPDGLVTIEGNTNGAGSRDGGTVIRHFRSWSSGIVSVHRPAYAITSTSGGFGTMTDEQITKLFTDQSKQADARFKALDKRLEKIEKETKGLHDRTGLIRRISRAVAHHVGVTQPDIDSQA